MHNVRTLDTRMGLLALHFSFLIYTGRRKRSNSLGAAGGIESRPPGSPAAPGCQHACARGELLAWPLCEAGTEKVCLGMKGPTSQSRHQSSPTRQMVGVPGSFLNFNLLSALNLSSTINFSLLCPSCLSIYGYLAPPPWPGQKTRKNSWIC